MKVSFSTNGWKDFDWQDFYSMAKDLEFDGIEIHGLTFDAFRSDNIVNTHKVLAGLGLEISCIDTTCNIADEESFEDNVKEIEKAIEAAKVLHCHSIRVRAGKDINDTDVNDEIVIACIEKVRRKAEKANVAILLETIGPYKDTERLRKVLMEFASDHVAALWDFYHTYQLAGEGIEESVQNLGAFIKHVHMKDAAVIDGKPEYCMVGEGNIPIDDIISGLRSINYEGFVSLEWIPEWLEELADPGIVFPHFINYMGRYADDPITSRHLYSNRAGTGKFIWEKDQLIDLTFAQVLDKQCEEFPDQYAFRYTTLDYTRT